MLVLTACRKCWLNMHEPAPSLSLPGPLKHYLTVYDTRRYCVHKFPTWVKQQQFFFLFFSFFNPWLDWATLCSKEWFNFLQMGFSKSFFFAEFRKRAHRCGTYAITTSLADRRALSHTTCTVELLYYILLVFLKCANTHKSAEYGLCYTWQGECY